MVRDFFSHFKLLFVVGVFMRAVLGVTKGSVLLLVRTDLILTSVPKKGNVAARQ